MKVVVGIDVGKRKLDVSVSQRPVRSFPNTAEGHRGAAELDSEPRRE